MLQSRKAPTFFRHTRDGFEGGSAAPETAPLVQPQNAQKLPKRTRRDTLTVGSRTPQPSEICTRVASITDLNFGIR